MIFEIIIRYNDDFLKFISVKYCSYYILIYRTNHMIFIAKELIYQFSDYLI